MQPNANTAISCMLWMALLRGQGLNGVGSVVSVCFAIHFGASASSEYKSACGYEDVKVGGWEWEKAEETSQKTSAVVKLGEAGSCGHDARSR